jgi:circadian clock protein KaiC
MTSEKEPIGPNPALAKVPTGIAGLDELTRGGLPAGRATLICGGPGCGKTVLATEILVRGAGEFDEPGVFVSFEEKPEQLIENSRSMGFDLAALVGKKKLKISYVELSKGEIVESGAFTLEALQIRLEHAIAELGAKRLVLDSIETIYSVLSQTEKLRAEVARLFHWLRDKGITAIVTAERGSAELTRHGFEEYLSDCVLLLDHRVAGQISRRRLRVVKYRGSAHAADECPFLIGETGLSVLPISSLSLDHIASSERVRTGVRDVDEMLGGEGYFKAATVLITGRPGTGKSSLAAAFAMAACERNERCLYFSFEESADQLTQNMKSLGIDLRPWLATGSLTVRAFRPTFRGLEEHLLSISHETQDRKPACVVIDPISNFITIGEAEEVRSLITRILDLLKRQGATLLMTALTGPETETYVSSLVDTWIALDLELQRHLRRRTIHVVKSRGMQHSHETRELVMSPQGISVRGLNGG